VVRNREITTSKAEDRKASGKRVERLPLAKLKMEKLVVKE
jgi:hypothetical protein